MICLGCCDAVAALGAASKRIADAGGAVGTASKRTDVSFGRLDVFFLQQWKHGN
jgi:hypothetical protein